LAKANLDFFEKIEKILENNFENLKNQKIETEKNGRLEPGESLL